MLKLTATEANGLRSAVEAEYESKRAAEEAQELFGSVAVFVHLEKSAARHVAALCRTLHSSEEMAPVLAPATPTSPATLIEALEAATDREERAAELYNELLQHTRNADLKSVLLPLWQSVSHLHLAALADQLSIERGVPGPSSL